MIRRNSATGRQPIKSTSSHPRLRENALANTAQLWSYGGVFAEITTTPLPAPHGSYWPFLVLAVSVVFVIVAISYLRIHAFLALIAAALFAGILAERLPGETGT